MTANPQTKPKTKRQPASKKPTTSYERPSAITPLEYGSLQSAFDFLNVELFDGGLPDAFIAYQRKPHSRGHLAVDRYIGRAGQTARCELALNPDAFIDRTDRQIVSTVLHEMVHLWQHHAGSMPSRGYHNREWGAKMRSVGLMPSNTGAVGGKQTGQQMTHYIIDGGPYDLAFSRLEATGWRPRDAVSAPCWCGS